MRAALAFSAAVLVAATSAASPGVHYEGGTIRTPVGFEISLLVHPGGTAEWQLGYVAPCTPGTSTVNGRDVGTTLDSRLPRLRITNGHFALRRHDYFPTSGLDQRYARVGARTSRGFSGTFWAIEESGNGACVGRATQRLRPVLHV